MVLSARRRVNFNIPVRRNAVHIEEVSETHGHMEQQLIQLVPNPLAQHRFSSRNVSLSYANPECSVSCPGASVFSLLLRKPRSFTFREACAIMVHCSVDAYGGLMKMIILSYSLSIYGLPECPAEDLLLAAYLFIEDVLGIQPEIELCVRYTEDDDSNVIGIVFNNSSVKRRILAKAECLEGTGVDVTYNDDIEWILDGFCSNV